MLIYVILSCSALFQMKTRGVYLKYFVNDCRLAYIIDAFWDIMKVGVGRNFGISQESLMHNSVFCRLPSCCFLSMECCVVMSSVGENSVPKFSKYKSR